MILMGKEYLAYVDSKCDDHVIGTLEWTGKNIAH
jgi:hypothetical protein